MSESAWSKLSRPPRDALKQITAGRLRGMSDVNPQWRYKVMHDVYGPCGDGWKYEISKVWTEQGLDGQVFMFAQVSVAVKANGSWSESIPGIGGSMLIEKESKGMHHNDEAVKMAVTDALSVALKMLGVAADIYMGRWDGTKYKDEARSPITPLSGVLDGVNDEDMEFLRKIASELVDLVEQQNNPAQAYDYLERQRLDNEQKLQLWEILKPNSKTRNQIKAEKEKRK